MSLYLYITFNYYVFSLVYTRKKTLSNKKLELAKGLVTEEQN